MTTTTGKRGRLMPAQRDRCRHGDVRLSEYQGRRAIACFACGRLFGHLNDADFFVAYNPPEVPRRFRAATEDELDKPA